MGEVVHRSEVVVEREKGPLRRARLPAEPEPVAFGVPGARAARCAGAPGTFEPHATTIDDLVAATAGRLTGTFGGALEARQVPAAEGRLVGRATGEGELEEKVLVVRRVHVRLEQRAAPEHRAIAERVHVSFADACPLYRTLRPAVAITTELGFTEG
jgi:hypothetical protein